jgi:hypothetical protein
VKAAPSDDHVSLFLDSNAYQITFKSGVVIPSRVFFNTYSHLEAVIRSHSLARFLNDRLSWGRWRILSRKWKRH